jgi:hypothetical protein
VEEACSGWAGEDIVRLCFPPFRQEEGERMGHGGFFMGAAYGGSLWRLFGVVGMLDGAVFGGLEYGVELREQVFDALMAAFALGLEELDFPLQGLNAGNLTVQLGFSQ